MKNIYIERMDDHRDIFRQGNVGGARKRYPKRNIVFRQGAPRIGRAIFVKEQKRGAESGFFNPKEGTPRCKEAKRPCPGRLKTFSPEDMYATGYQWDCPVHFFTF
ncbi:hypothetical protein MPLDJ20_80236 [Mesorhizobium plurifarium]|uniref:Uncharacterized protein n=1 Tax=Mesorhizobium plurifarium TaxID=69974 RepID=A0A090FX34_MESPL|nr:hypothetical protein MPLDJ20_80236 [Mesorhizobium plurifarium]